MRIFRPGKIRPTFQSLTWTLGQYSSSCLATSDRKRAVTCASLSDVYRMSHGQPVGERLFDLQDNRLLSKGGEAPQKWPEYYKGTTRAAKAYNTYGRSSPRGPRQRSWFYGGWRKSKCGWDGSKERRATNSPPLGHR